MTREEVMAIMPDATKEQIDAFLNRFNKDIAAERTASQKLRAKADTADDLKKQLDAINEQGMTEMQKIQKQLDAAEKRAEAAENSVKRLESLNKLAEIGITGETAEKYIDSISAGDSSHIDVLGLILTSAKENAAKDMERQIAENSDIPSGRTDDGAEETPDIAMAKQLNFGNETPSTEARNHYLVN